MDRPRSNLALAQPPNQRLSPTLAHALEELLRHTARRVRDGARSPATLDMQERHAGWLRAQLDPELLIEDLGELQILQFAESARVSGGAGGRRLSLRTLAKRLSSLHRALVLARKRGELARVPEFPEIALPPARPEARILRCHEELDRLCHALPPHRALWVELCFWTCQHASDVERMTWADVDLEAPSMLIRNTKNRKPWGLRVKMPAPLAERLRARRAELPATPAPGARLVLPWPNRSAMLPKYSVLLGLPPINATRLRHSGISAMVRRVGLTRAAQEWGGWSSYAMMERYYAHALPPQLDECADELASWADAASAEKGGRR